MDDLDRILSADDPLVPSSGFAARVMEAVQQAAEEPAPLRFPWWRFSVGVLASVVWAAATVSAVPGLGLSLSAEALPGDAVFRASLVALLAVSVGTLALWELRLLHDHR